MKIKEITLSKEYKQGLPGYSNITAGVSVTFQVEEGEKPECSPVWASINKQIVEQIQDYKK